MMRRHILMVGAVSTLTWGCQPDIPVDPEPSGGQVVAVFDTETATIPLPNTAALDEDGTLPNLGSGTEGAEKDFLDWLGGLHGWSESTPITVPFSGALDPDTVNGENVKLWRLDGGVATELGATPVYVENDEEGSVCNPDVCGSVIIIQPDATPQFGATYAAVVTKGVQGANGEPVSESAALFFAASPEPLFDFETQEVKVSVLDDDPAQAAQLEGLRMLLAPVYAAAADADISRDDVAAAFTWSVATDPFTVLDPATATLPIPNDIALDSDGTFPAAALNFCGGPNVTPEQANDPSCDAEPADWVSCESNEECTEFTMPGRQARCLGARCVFFQCAQGTFDQYLDGLHGWPTTTPITLPVTSAIDPATLTPENVQLWRVDGDSPGPVEGISVSMSECGGEILISLPENTAMAYNAKYVAFATKGVLSTALDEDGTQLPLTPSAPILLALMPNDPATAVGTCTAEEVGNTCDGGGICGTTFGAEGQEFNCYESTISRVPDADAAAVMAVRPLFRGAVGAIEGATDLEWDDLAAAWTWTTWTDTFLVFDPAAGNIPFPHTLLTSGCSDEEPICNLPPGNEATEPLLAELRKREGFSTTGTHWIPTLGPPPQLDTVSTDTVLFAEADEIPPPLFPAEEYEVRYEYGHILLDFLRPLTPDILVAGLSTTDIIGGNGFPAQPTPAFVFLRSEYPLVDADGNKTVKEIPDNATAAVLEASRSDFEQLFIVALLFGYGRTEINNAWAFDTGRTYRPLQELRALTLARVDGDGLPAITPDPAPVTDDMVAAPDDMTAMVDMSNVAAIHDVSFDSYDWIGADNRIVDAANLGRETVGVTVYLPDAANGCTAPFDVALVQHGLGGFRKRMGHTLANDLAAACIATVAMDLPLHGGRAPGSMVLHPDDTPANSGDGFVSADFPATVAYFQQGVIDLVVLTDIIKNGGLNTALGTTFSNTDSQIGYAGLSLGSFVGVLFATIDPNPVPTVVSVGGGDFGIVLTESASFSSLLDGVGLMPGTFSFVQAIHFIDWLGEWVDPYTFAPYTVKDPLAELTYDGESFQEAGDPMPSKQVMIQMVTDDMTVPNSSTELLARTMGVSLDGTTYPAGTPHGFLGDPASESAAAECGRMQVVQWLRSSFETGTATLPANLEANTCIAAQ